jgi:hypothetical protein
LPNWLLRDLAFGYRDHPILLSGQNGLYGAARGLTVDRRRSLGFWGPLRNSETSPTWSARSQRGGGSIPGE